MERGLAVVREAGMEDYVASLMLHAAATRTALANGSPSEARLAIARVNRLRPRVTASLPIPALQMRYETIRACIVLREATAARTLMLEVKDILRQCPDLGTLSDAGGGAGAGARVDPIVGGRAVDADDGGAAPARLPPDPPDVPRDRRSVVRVVAHRQVPGHGDLREAGRVVAPGSHRAGGRRGAARRVRHPDA